MNCPVCPIENIADDLLSCPNCSADLKPLRRITGLTGHHYNQGLKSAQAGEWETAEEFLRTAIGLDASSLLPRLLLGKVLWNRKKFSDARSEWQKVAIAEPENTEVKQLLSQVIDNETPSPAKHQRFIWVATTFIGTVVLISCIFFYKYSTISDQVTQLKNYKHDHQVSNSDYESFISGHKLTTQKLTSIEVEYQEYRNAHKVSNNTYADVLNEIKRKNANFKQIEMILHQERNKRQLLEQEVQKLKTVTSTK